MAVIHISQRDLARIGGLSPLEDQIQVSIVEWLRTMHPWLHVHHVPNGGKRHMRVALDMDEVQAVDTYSPTELPAQLEVQGRGGTPCRPA